MLKITYHCHLIQSVKHRFWMYMRPGYIHIGASTCCIMTIKPRHDNCSDGWRILTLTGSHLLHAGQHWLYLSYGLYTTIISHAAMTNKLYLCVI